MATGGFFGRIFSRLKRNPPPAPPPKAPPPPPPPGPPPSEEGEEVFESSDSKIRTAVKLQKRAFWEDVVQYGRRASDAAVDESDDIDEMIRALRRENRNDATWTELASLASRAHILRERTGSAGELEVYLPYSFLWYHYLG